ncbi:MAG: Hsp20/alpha crystallin family protein [Candidatus Ranarchaeia archaeon]|jgi:HSP20 family molecular chaperone IbpA
MTKKDEKDKMKDFFDFLKEWMTSHSPSLNEFDPEGLPFSNLQDLMDNPMGSFFYAMREMISPDGERKVIEWGTPPSTKGDEELNHFGTSSTDSKQNREIFNDIIEEGNKFKILIDIRGKNPDHIKIEATEDTLRLNQEGQELTEIRLPSPIKPTIQKKEVHNGILTVEVEKMKG